MHESTVTFSTGKIVTMLAWGWVVGLLGSAWLVVFMNPQHWRFAVMLAASACASSAMAAVFHIRTYVVRICALLRSTRTLDAADELRPVVPFQPVR